MLCMTRCEEKNEEDEEIGVLDEESTKNARQRRYKAINFAAELTWRGVDPSRKRERIS